MNYEKLYKELRCFVEAEKEYHRGEGRLNRKCFLALSALLGWMSEREAMEDDEAAAKRFAELVGK